MNEESNVIRCRKDGLLIDIIKCKNCDYVKWCSSQRKRQETINQKNKLNEDKIKHIGVWLNKNSVLSISREHYAVIDKRNSFWSPKYVRTMMKYCWKDGVPDWFEDSTCKTYTEEWCEEHRQDCLKNFDINMSRFDGITQERFENVLNFLKSSAPLQKVDDLSLCNCSGIYIMVLNKYKQLYIGQAKNIKERIKHHWYAKKEFDRLLFGKVEQSIISIDSFGALDTTDIYILPMSIMNLNEAEKAFVNSINPIFLLNRVDGGELSVISVYNNILSTNDAKTKNHLLGTHDFVELPKKQKKKPIKEKYIKPVEIKIFSEDNQVPLESIAEQDIVCVRLGDDKYIGKVDGITKCFIEIIEYGKGDFLEIETQKTKKLENGYMSKKRFSKKSIQNISTVKEKVYNKNKVFYKVVSHKDLEVWE